MKKRKIREVANTCVIPISTLFGWMHGVKPSMEQLSSVYRLADHFGLSFEELVFNRRVTSENQNITSCSYVDDNQVRYRVVVERVVKN